MSGNRSRSQPGKLARALASAAFFLTLATLAACAEGEEAVDMWALALGDADLGRDKIEIYGCPACHTIPGIAAANALVGPPLTGWSQRTYIAGQLPNEPDNLVAWLMDPPAIDEDTAMPDMGITEADARDIAAYLYTLGEGLPDTSDPLSAQPVAFSHALHAGELALDCRYCHTSVTEARFAGMPSTRTCMTCHAEVFEELASLAPVRLSWQYDAPIPWVRVVNLHDSVQFDHAAHVNIGVGCDLCHGRVDEMRVTEQPVAMTMSWCLDCHRDPAPHLRSQEAVFDPTWTPPADQQQQGVARLQEHDIRLETLTDCSSCHY